MGWLEDARKKAEDATEEAKTKATEKAAEAAVAAAGAAVSKSVGSFFEGIVSSAEGALAEAEERAGARGTLVPPVDGVDAAANQLEEDLEAPVEDALGDALRAHERTVLEDEVPAPVQAPPPRSSRDPMQAAREAIARSREARGLDPYPVEPELPTRSNDPVADALAAAAEARAFASAGGSAGLAREAAAREQLAALKAGRGMKPADNDRDDDDEPSPPSSTGKRRTL